MLKVLFSTKGQREERFRMERVSDPNSGTFQSGARKEGRLPAGLISDAGLYRKASEQDPDRDPQVSVQREGRH